MYGKKQEASYADDLDDYLGKSHAKGSKHIRKQCTKRLLRRKLRRNQYEICQKEFRHFLENAKCELPDIRVPG